MKSSVFNIFRRKSADGSGTIGLWVQPDGVAMARVLRQGATPKVTSCEFRPIPIGSEPAFVLRAMINALGPDPGPCNYVMPPQEYQTLLVDTPDVSASEMREAVRWKVHDLIDMPLNDATIDVFDIPEQINHGEERPRSLCVVVSASDLIEQKVSLLTRCGCQLSAIDITEMSLRNLSALQLQDKEGQVVLHMEEEYSLVVITKLATIYLSRRVSIGSLNFKNAQTRDDNGAEAARLLEILSEELYRSLEYCESRFQGLAPSTITLTPAAYQLSGLSQGLSEASALPVNHLDLESLLPGANKIPAERQSACLLAVGAALRHEQTTL